MKFKDHVCLMADYNQWMNQKIYEAVESLPPEEVYENKGAFFGSIFATLTHIAVGDTIWLNRFASTLQQHQAFAPIIQLPCPTSLDEILCETVHELKNRRQLLDESLSNFAASISEEELSHAISYKNIKGELFTKNLFSLLMHVFNHQTHHRGQVTTMLSQSGVDVGITDLVFIVPNV